MTPEGARIARRFGAPASCLSNASREQARPPWRNAARTSMSPSSLRRQRREMETRISTAEGILLRQNRSMQVEGAFGVLKRDMEFRGFLLRGLEKVQTEFLLLAMAYNTNKLYNKIQKKRCGDHLHFPEVA